MFNSISQMFAPAPAATPAPAGVTPANNSATTPGNMPAAPSIASSGGTPGAAANGIVPAGTNIENKQQSPMDAFSDFWKNDGIAATQAAPIFNATKDDMITAAAKADFRSLIKPEDLQAIAAGGEAAQAAFLNAINSVAQNVYAQSAFASTQLIQRAVDKNNETIRGEIPNIVKKHNVNDGLRTENAAFSHPAAQPIIHSIEQQMIQKYPNATAAELRGMAVNYLQTFASSINPTAGLNTNSPTNLGNLTKETDWSSFLE